MSNLYGLFIVDIILISKCFIIILIINTSDIFLVGGERPDVLDGGILTSEFELLLIYSVHFWTNALEKYRDPLTPSNRLHFVWFGFFYGKSIIVDYSMPNPFYTYILNI